MAQRHRSYLRAFPTFVPDIQPRTQIIHRGGTTVNPPNTVKGAWTAPCSFGCTVTIYRIKLLYSEKEILKSMDSYIVKTTFRLAMYPISIMALLKFE